MKARPLNSKFILLLLVCLAFGLSAAGLLLVGNLRTAAAGMPPDAFLSGFAGQATYVLAPTDATPTPTPFQPLAPTATLIAIQTQAALPTQPASDTPAGPVLTQAQLTPEPTRTVSGEIKTAVPAGSTPGTPTASPLPPTPELTAAPEMEKLPSQINILLLGSDRRPWDAGFRTDTIILLTVNTDLGRVNLTSFPRDLWVMLPGWGQSRINTAWTYGGYKMLKDTFQHNFGVNVDYHILIDFSSFKKFVDSLGGLTVQVAEPVADYRAGYWVKIPKGAVEMNADTVLWYVRTRKTTNDIARNRRQQEVLNALFEKLVSIDIIRKAPEIWDAYDHSVKTDLTMLDVIRWLPFAAKIIKSRDIHSYAITYNHVYDWITPEGAMVLVPNKEAVMNVIRKSQNLK